MPETPAEELRAAAKTLREAAKVATAGPWKASPVWSPRSHAKSAVYSHAHRAGTVESEVVASGLKDRSGGIVQPGNAVWIATAHPGLAEPLAVWLSEFADWHEGTVTEVLGEMHHGDGCEGPIEECACFDKALAVARVINGGAS